MSYELKETILYIDNVELGYGEGSDYKCVLKNINLIEKDVVGRDILLVKPSQSLVGLVEVNQHYSRHLLV